MFLGVSVLGEVTLSLSPRRTPPSGLSATGSTGGVKSSGAASVLGSAYSNSIWVVVLRRAWRQRSKVIERLC